MPLEKEKLWGSGKTILMKVGEHLCIRERQMMLPEPRHHFSELDLLLYFMIIFLSSQYNTSKGLDPSLGMPEILLSITPPSFPALSLKFHDQSIKSSTKHKSTFFLLSFFLSVSAVSKLMSPPLLGCISKGNMSGVQCTGPHVQEYWHVSYLPCDIAQDIRTADIKFLT